MPNTCSNDVTTNHDSLETLKRELDSLTPFQIAEVNEYVKCIKNSSSKNSNSIDEVLMQIPHQIIFKPHQSHVGKNKYPITEKQKIWIMLKILEILHDENSKTKKFKEKFEESHHIINGHLNKTEKEIKFKYDLIKNYHRVLAELIKIFSPFFENYMKKNKKNFFAKKMKEEHKEIYWDNIMQHYAIGAVWSNENNTRSNIIRKVEAYFREFDTKSNTSSKE